MQDDCVDFREFVCGLSAMCRGPYGERLKFIFKMLANEHGRVLKSDLVSAIEETSAETEVDEEDRLPDADELDLAAYLEWATNSQRLDGLAHMLLVRRVQ